MGSINFSGLGTGIDWNLIINAEIQARTRQVITPIQEWKTSWENKISAFDQLRSLLTALQSAVQDMDTPSELRCYTVQSSSEEVVGATVSGTASPGTYSVEVNQMADAEVEIHNGVDEAATLVNNSGADQDFVYSYAGESITLEVASGTTLEDLAALINNDADNPGVTAYILDDGSGGSTSHHLVLRGNDTGSTYTIAIDAGSTTLAGDWGNLTADASPGNSSVTVDDVSPFHQYQAIIVDDDDSSAEHHIITSIASNTLSLRGTLGDDFTVAQNAYATPRGTGSGLTSGATSGSSEVTVDDASHFQVGKSVIVADGSNSEELTVSAVDTATNTITFTTNLSNNYASDGYVTQLEGGRKFEFEDTDFTESQSAQNAQIRVDGYPSGSWIERETNTLGTVIYGVTLTLKGTTDGSPVTITVNEDPEGIKEKVNGFVTAYNAVKTFLNNNTDYNADTEEAGVLLGNYAAQFIESQLRDILISLAPGFEDGVDTYTHLGEIGVESLGRTDDESALGTLVVDEDELDEALADNFEAVISLLSDSFSGYSDSGYITFYQASETLTTAGKYDIEADFDGSGNLTGGRMKLTTESSFRNATANDPYLVGTSDNPEHALWVRCVWDGSSSTQTAVVRVTQGIAGRVADLLDEVLDTTDGVLHNIGQSYDEIVGEIDDRIEREEERLEQLREKLVMKYSRLEQLLVELQGRYDWAQTIAGSMGWSAQS